MEGLSERAFFYRYWGLPKIRLTVKTAFLKKALQLTYYLDSFYQEEEEGPLHTDRLDCKHHENAAQ